MSSIKIDRPFLRAFTKDAEAALSKVAKQYGITVSYKSGSFDKGGKNASL